MKFSPPLLRSAIAATKELAHFSEYWIQTIPSPHKNT
jgi:hypothetical protein